MVRRLSPGKRFHVKRLLDIVLETDGKLGLYDSVNRLIVTVDILDRRGKRAVTVVQALYLRGG